MNFAVTFLEPWMGGPFCALVALLFLAPSFFAHGWHRYGTRILMAATGAFVLSLMVYQGPYPVMARMLHDLSQDYVPFLLIFSIMYILSSFINIKLHYAPTPLFQTAFLALGTFLASVLGTLDTSMILLQPLLQTTQRRRYHLHTLLVFTFLVCNIGGCLSPLGDPPLFLGFLKGVPFLWPLKHLWPFVAVMVLPLLAGYYVLDSFFYAKEVAQEAPQPLPKISHKKITLTGLPFMMGILGVLLIMIYAHLIPLEVRYAVLSIALAGLILWVKIGKSGKIDWAPLVENIVTFGALFLFSIPIMDQLSSGQWDTSLKLIKGPYEAVWAFWISGLLSAVLDNGPTYLLGFQALGGKAHLLASGQTTLAALSVGSVFLGALTYIGNAPNLMVLSLARRRGMTMPSTMAYTAWACASLLPGFLIITFWMLWP